MKEQRAENIHLFCCNLYNFRIEKNLTQEELANLSGVHQADISDMESNSINDIQGDTIAFLADALGKNVADFFVK